MSGKRILIIKLGALGDVVMALGALAALRRQHADDHITVLTRRVFEPLIRASRLADTVLADPTPRPTQFGRILKLRKLLRAGAFDLVFDLQGSDRSLAYRALLWPNATARMFAQRRARRGPPTHALDRHAEVLRAAGIAEIAAADLSWLHDDLEPFDLPEAFVVLVPGSSPHRLDKRWPVAAYGEVAQVCAALGITPVVIGSCQEAGLGREVARICPAARDLTGRTSFGHIAELGRGARAAIGNDTGPMHILAATGCPSLVLFSAASDPAASLPLGPKVGFLKVDRLCELPVQRVLDTIAFRDSRGTGGRGPSLG